MTPKPLDLKAAWEKFLAGVLRVLTMGKFWLYAASVGTAYSQLAVKGITPPEFVGVVAAGGAVLIYSIAKEDAAEKSASPTQPRSTLGGVTVAQLPPADTSPKL